MGNIMHKDQNSLKVKQIGKILEEINRGRIRSLLGKKFKLYKH